MFGNVFSCDIQNTGVTDVNISGNDYVGGLVGYNSLTTINNCYNTGSVTGADDFIGGLVGRNNGTVENCYSTGNVSGDYRIGGLVGYLESSAHINNSYSTGAVSGNTQTGGLVGRNYSSTTSSCFWDTQTSGTSTGIGDGTTTGATGKTTAEMKDYNTFTAAGWDFVSESANGNDDYWDADKAGTVNNGYVILSWQSGADNSLPVDLSFFKAKVESGKIILTWKTESETENLGYIIESRLKGDEFWFELDNFTNNEALEGHGSTSKSYFYEYTDTKTMAGFTHEYQLSDVDYAGKITQHPIIEILLPEPRLHLLPGHFALKAMYPNPFNPSLNIRFETGEATQVRVIIFDLQGLEVATLTDKQHHSGFHELIWSADYLPSGVYLVRIETKQGMALKKVTLLK